MVFEYFRKGPYLDVEDVLNPPPGAKHVMAELLNGMEDAHVEAFKRLNGHLSETALNATFASKDSVELGTADLDTITEPGAYYQGTYSNGSPDSNYPTQGYGLLEVVANPDRSNIYQVFTSHAPAAGDTTRYNRASHNGTWTAWEKLASSTEIEGAYAAKPAAGTGYAEYLVAGANAASIQGQLDALEARGGGRLQLDGGVYEWDDTITIPANITIEGCGIGATILRIPDNAPAFNGILAKNDGVSSTKNITICNLTLDGNKEGQGSTGGTTRLLSFKACPNLRIQNIEVKNGRAVGLRHTGDGEFTGPIYLENVWVHDNAGDGIRMEFRSRNTFYTNVLSENNGGIGFYCDQSEVHLNFVVTKNNGGNGFEFNNIQRSSLNNIYSTFNGGHGIFVQSVITSQGTNWLAQNNGTSGAGFADIYFDNDATQSYGINDDLQISGIWVGADEGRVSDEIPTTTEDYGLYVMDGHIGAIELRDVHAKDANLAKVRLPAVLRNLHVDGWSEPLSLGAPQALAVRGTPNLTHDSRHPCWVLGGNGEIEGIAGYVTLPSDWQQVEVSVLWCTLADATEQRVSFTASLYGSNPGDTIAAPSSYVTSAPGVGSTGAMVESVLGTVEVASDAKISLLYLYRQSSAQFDTLTSDIEVFQVRLRRVA